MEVYSVLKDENTKLRHLMRGFLVQGHRDDLISALVFDTSNRKFFDKDDDGKCIDCEFSSIFHRCHPSIFTMLGST